VNHPTHIAHKTQGHPIGSTIITKWRLNTQAEFYDGEKGRGADNFQKDPVILEVFSLGTVVTSWTHYTTTSTDKDGHHHTEQHDAKYETEFVDRVEFRLVFRGALWAQWFIEGDSMHYGNATCNSNSPFFETKFEGGWFSPSVYRVKTIPGVDSCFALMLSHVCCTEYSIAEIKRDLQVNTPMSPNHGMQFLGLQGRNNMYQSPVQVNPSVSFTFKMN